jgi:hypothetical protein
LSWPHSFWSRSILMAKGRALCDKGLEFKCLSHRLLPTRDTFWHGNVSCIRQIRLRCKSQLIVTKFRPLGWISCRTTDG